jgi:hypothetical protein
MSKGSIVGMQSRDHHTPGDWTGDQRTLRGYIDEAGRWDGTSANSLGL